MNRVRHHIEFPEPICMTCGRRCEITEEVSTDQLGGHIELWCYCESCDIDTFHPPLPGFEWAAGGIWE